MKKASVIVGLMIAVLFAMTASAQVCQAGPACCPKACDKSLEQLILLKMADEFELDSYDLSEMLTGHDEYRALMGPLTAQRDEAAAELAAAVDAGASGTELTGMMEDLMDLDLDILEANQEAVRGAGQVLGAAAQAKLYLIVSDMDGAKKMLVCAITGRGAVCPKVAGTCPKAAAACAAGAPAAAAAAPVQSDEAIIMAGVALFTTKLAEQDIEGALVGVSDDFDHYEFGDKEGLLDFLQQAVDMGYLEDIEVSTEDAEVEIDGDEATVYPVDVEGAFGSVTLEFILEKIDGIWSVTSLDASGI